MSLNTFTQAVSRPVDTNWTKHDNNTSVNRASPQSTNNDFLAFFKRQIYLAVRPTIWKIKKRKVVVTHENTHSAVPVIIKNNGRSLETVRTNTVIDERSWPQPQLCTVLTGWIHDAEVVLAVPEQHVLLALRELGDAAHQVLDLVISFPVKTAHEGKGLFHATCSSTSEPRLVKVVFRNSRQALWPHHSFVATILAPFCSDE